MVRGRAADPRSLREKLWTPKGVLAILGGLVLLGMLALVVAYLVIPVPDPNEKAQAQTSIIYYADGKTEMHRFAEVNRESIPLSQVPVHVQQAMLAAEDRSFYDNPGFSPTGIARAVWAAATGGPTQGGSTITQQYVKNYFLSQDQTMGRKVRELIISIKIEQQQSKDQILENYLNTIYYGRGASGIQAASRAYFDKTADKLTVGEGALLASVIRAPSLYDPALGAQQEKNARARVDYVLDGMVEKGWLTAAQRAQVTFPTVAEARANQAASGPNGYIVAMVKNELSTKIGLSEAEVDRGGLRITTTIARDAQTDAINAVERNRPSGGRGDDVRVGLASIKPGDGAILAIYGGKDYRTQAYSAATQAQLQAGSTFKVFALVAALEKGISTRTVLDGSSPQYFPQFRGGDNTSGKVTNFGGASYGRLTLRDATAKSVNTAYAELNIEVGPKATQDMAVRLGLPANTAGLSDNYANVFGTASPRVIDMANAYATLAAGGKRVEPYIVKAVTSVDESFAGWNASPQVSDAVSAEVAADAVDAMTRVVREGTAVGARALGRPAAGKTGTTTENRAVWFDGFTPQAATAVALYLPDKDGNAQPLQGIGGRSELTGGSYPVQIWTAFMQGLLEGQPVQDFPDRAGVGDSDVQWEPPAQTQTSSSAPAPTSESPSTSPTTAPTTTWTPTDGPSEPTQEPSSPPEPRPSTPSRRQPTATPEDQSGQAGQQGGEQDDAQAPGRSGQEGVAEAGGAQTAGRSGSSARPAGREATADAGGAAPQGR